MITVYFMHETLTPANARATWDGASAIPAVGSTVHLNGAGYMGADVDWQVARVHWLNETAVTLFMAGDDGGESR